MIISNKNTKNSEFDQVYMNFQNLYVQESCENYEIFYVCLNPFLVILCQDRKMKLSPRLDLI